MEFTCPYRGCGKPVTLSQVVCPHCQNPLTFWAILGYYRKRAMQSLRKKTKVRCPQCGKALPLSATTCPKCDTSMAFEDALERVLAPARAWWAQFRTKADKDPVRMRRIQWCHLFLSALLLWVMVSYVTEHRAQDWLWHVGLSAVYLAVIAFLTSLIAPRDFFAIIAWCGWRVKIGLVFNYFTLLLLLEITIGTFWKRAVTLGTLFAVTYAAFLILTVMLRPMASSFPRPSRQFDPTAPQGRRARHD